MQYDPLLGRYTRKAFARKIELDFSNIEDESDNENVSNANRSQARKLPDWTKKQEPNSHTSDKKEKEKTERKPPRGVTKTKNGLTRNEIIKKHGIKRPASGYIRFTQEFRQRKNKDSVKMKMTEMTKAAAELWKSMTTEQKAPYNDACEKEKAIFEEKVQEAINNDDGKPYDPETRKRKSSTVKGSLASIIQNNVKIKRGLKGKRVPRSSLRRRNGKYLPLDAEDHDPEFGDLDDFGGFTEHDKEIVHELPNPNGGNNSNLNEDNSDSDEYDDDEIESTYDSEPDKTQTKDDTKRSLNLFDENDSDNEELFGLIGLGLVRGYNHMQNRPILMTLRV
eukprot:TRINITY_DN3461_c0_g1_i2.p1 TRINITY_DN3461_c0_g1~~TRINITY_DN3461_c0_g1_i2.p1  ORF type:complete len:336 (-),score=73.60 TRINITY_DN3461_c0_g1_i2:81-1088(-)